MIRGEIRLYHMFKKMYQENDCFAHRIRSQISASGDLKAPGTPGCVSTRKSICNLRGGIL